MAASKKIKCTYDDCFQHFKSQEAMIKHKVKDPEHEYCKRCDVDCDDPTSYLIHQISNPSKHIVCCICGLEFGSEAGRDGHVELQHRKAQNLQCPGCSAKFTTAAAMMGHIEHNECPVLTSDIFAQQRAEKQIVKDAWESALDANRTNFLAPQQGLSESTGGVNLLDDAASQNADWNNDDERVSNLSSLEPISKPPSSNPKSLVQSLNALSMDKFPSLSALDSGPKRDSRLRGQQTTNNEDVMPLSTVRSNEKSNLGSANPWSREKPTAKGLFPEGIKNGGENSSVQNQQRSMFNGPNEITGFNKITTAAKAANMDPNLPYAQVRTVPNLERKSLIDPYNFYDSIAEKFNCPGQGCGRSFKNPEDFRAHLVTGVHSTGKRTCPSCLKMFVSTTALVAHCESPSRKCNIRKSTNYEQVLRDITAGLLGTEGHLVDGSVKYVANPVKDW